MSIVWNSTVRQLEAKMRFTEAKVKIRIRIKFEKSLIG